MRSRLLALLSVLILITQAFAGTQSSKRQPSVKQITDIIVLWNDGIPAADGDGKPKIMVKTINDENVLAAIMSDLQNLSRRKPARKDTTETVELLVYFTNGSSLILSKEGCYLFDHNRQIGYQLSAVSNAAIEKILKSMGRSSDQALLSNPAPRNCLFF